MAIPISKLYGVPRDVEVRLKSVGVRRTDVLLERCRTGQGRKSLALRLDVETGIVERLAQRADLSRIRGIGGVYLALLEAVGVESMVDLAGRDPDELRERLEYVGLQQDLIDRVPSPEMVRGWVAKANSLPCALET